MKRSRWAARIRFVATVIALGALFGACKSGATARGETITKPFLWKVTKDKQVGYLLGTMHLGIDAEKRFPKLVWDTLAKADSVCLETDMGDSSAAKAFMRTDGTTLEEELGPETWAKLSKILGTSVAERMTDLKASAAVTVLMIKDIPPTPSMDDVVQQRASRAGAKVEYLEAGSFQIGLLNKYFTAETIKYVVSHRNELKRLSGEMVTAYERGDDHAIVGLLTNEAYWKASGGKQGMEALMFARNATWLPKFREMMASGKAFCAVGVGHLVGERSLNDLLRKSGYSVERVVVP